MTENRPWMPLYVADYLADTRHLSTVEHGAYLLLIMHAWMNEGRLPADEARLARIAGLSAKEWTASRDVILQFFLWQDDGYRHMRVEAEIARAEGLIEKRRRAGRVSAERRKQHSANTCSAFVETSVPPSGSAYGQQSGRPSQSPCTASAKAAAAATGQHQPLPPPKTPMTFDWQPSPDDLAFVALSSPGSAWPAEKLKRVTHEFIAYYRSRGALSADWSADFRRWILRQPRFEQSGDADPSPAGFLDPILRAIETEMGA